MKKKAGRVLLFACIGFLLTGCTSKHIAELLTRQCMIEGCSEKLFKEGLCQKHYQQIYETEASEEVKVPEEGDTSDEAAAQGKEPLMTESETMEAAELLESRNGQAADLEGEICYIRDTYAYANTYYTYADRSHSLRQKNGYDGSDGVNFPDGFSYYDEDGNLIKLQREDSSGLRVEAYYINPALGRDVPEVSYLDTLVVFALATDADGGEYRLYFSNGNIIRYIGPDKKVVDYPYPDGLNWMEFSWSGASLSGGEQIQNILMLLSPMWYIPYESGGDDDFFTDDPGSVLNVVHEDVLESILSRECFQIYNQNFNAYYGSFTKEYVQEAAWDYLYYDYFNRNLLMPENPADEQWAPYASSEVYYDLDKVNARMENIYGIPSVFAPGDVCCYSYSGYTSPPFLEVFGNRVMSQDYWGNSGDPVGYVEITAYSFADGFLDIAGYFSVESDGGMLAEDVLVTARFKVNVNNDFPYQLLSCDVDAG